MKPNASSNSILRWATVLVLISSAPCMALMFTALGPILPAIAAHFADRGMEGALAAQLVMTMPGVGVIIGGWLTGWMAERLGPRRLLFLMLAAYGLAGSLGAYAERIEILLALRLFVGIAACGIGAAALVLISQHYQGAERARIIGYQGGAGAYFGVASLLLAGTLAESGSWRTPFFLYFLGFVLLGIALLVRGRLGAGRPDTPETRDAPSATEGGSWQTIRQLWPLYLLIIALMVAYFTNAVQLAFLLAADGTASPLVQSLVLSSSAIANASSSWAYGWASQRIGGTRTFRIGLALLALGYGFTGLTSGPIFTAAGAAVAGMGSGVLLPHLLCLLLQQAPESLRARASGLFYTAVYLGDFLNPLVVAPVRLLFGIHGVFLTMGILVGAGLVFSSLPSARPKAG